jgi:integrase
VYDGLIPANLARGVRLPASDHNKTEMVVLTPNEFTTLLAAFPEHWQPLIATLAGTGMRWGEATALHVGAVDLDSSPPTIRVQQAWKRTGKSARTMGAPKTKKGRRTISLSRGLVDILRPLVEGRPSDALVFTALEGGVIHHGTFYPRVWKPALKKAGLTKRPRIHDLRHSHATWMLAAGRPIDRVQRRLGHESIQTTVDTYGHAMPDDQRGDAAAIEAALAGALPLAIED